MTVVFSTCWYPFRAKFNTEVYETWIDHMITNVDNYFLVIYTNQAGLSFLTQAAENPRIKIIMKTLEEFRQYCHKEKWIENHNKNIYLNTRVSWEVSVLWAEKVHFVKQTIQKEYFPRVQWYGWCDIGYFRPKSGGCLTSTQIRMWPNPTKIADLNPDKIHYALVNPYVVDLMKCIQNKNPITHLPHTPIPPNQMSIAGGFFLTTPENLDWWATTFDDKLALYFKHDTLVKDDQIIIADCVFTDPTRFKLHREDTPGYDNWFMFQRLLM